MFSINHLIIGVPNDLAHTVPISQALEVNSPYGAFFFLRTNLVSPGAPGAAVPKEKRVD